MKLNQLSGFEPMHETLDKKALTERLIKRELDSSLVKWTLEVSGSNNELYRRFSFDSFDQALLFMNKAASGPIAKLNHHPRWQNNYNRLDVWLTTHESGCRVTEKDILLAKSIDLLLMSFSTKN